MELVSVAVDGEDDILKKAVETLNIGKVIVYPTDTVYGVGADATSEKAVGQVFELKGKPSGEPISVLVSDFAMLEEYARLDTKQLDLARELLPGRVTVVLDAKGLAKNLSMDGSIGFRIPVSPFCISLVEEFGKPITTTSANPSGKSPASSIEVAVRYFGDRVALYIDYGEQLFSPSTVVDLREKPKILREGSDIGRVKQVLGSL